MGGIGNPALVDFAVRIEKNRVTYMCRTIVNVNTLSISDGSGAASNYTLTNGTLTMTILPRTTTVSGTKVYDGTTTVRPENLTSFKLHYFNSLNSLPNQLSRDSSNNNITFIIKKFQNFTDEHYGKIYLTKDKIYLNTQVYTENKPYIETSDNSNRIFFRHVIHLLFVSKIIIVMEREKRGRGEGETTKKESKNKGTI